MFSRLFKRKSKASLDSIRFDASRHRYAGEGDGQRTWFTPEGDGIGLFFFPEPPDLPAQARTAAELQEFYRGRICNEQVRMVEFRLPQVADLTGIWMVLKIPSKPHGMTYIGSLTLPFAAFSFVIKMQCEEHGITGVREAALFLKAGHQGKPIVDADGKFTEEWNPDDECHDAGFPDHPVSRLRREFAHIRATLHIEENTRHEKRFALPTEAGQRCV
jgi:hypothetical protein